MLNTRSHRRAHCDWASPRHVTRSFVCVSLQNIDSWSFDAFAVNAASDGNALKYIGYDMLQRYDLIAKFKVRV